MERYYQVSNLGRVRSKDRIVITPKTSYFKKGRILIPSLDGKGNYLFVGLHVNNKVKLIYIHRLVAQNFIPNPHNYKHINENKKDNRADNLEWCIIWTNELGFCRSNISKCCEGKYKQANNLIWKFKKV